MKRLKDHADGKLEKPLDQSQIKAYEVVLDRLVPKLSAVEQTNIEEPPAEGEIMASLAHLIAGNPALLKPLIESDPGVRAALKSLVDGVPTVVETQQRSAA